MAKYSVWFRGNRDMSMRIIEAMNAKEAKEKFARAENIKVSSYIQARKTTSQESRKAWL